MKISSEFVEFIKDMVAAGGGEFVGLQEGIDDEYFAVLFNSPYSKSTLGLPLDSISTAAIKEHIRKSDRKFGKKEEN